MHLQAFSAAKDPDRPEANEDRLVVVADRLYAVIDGVTDRTGRRYGDRTGGRLAAETVERALLALAPGEASACKAGSADSNGLTGDAYCMSCHPNGIPGIEVVHAADRTFLFKTAIKDVLAQRGVMGTFMGKPWNDEGGSGFHLHFSVNDAEGVNQMGTADGELSPTALAMMAGYLWFMERRSPGAAPAPVSNCSALTSAACSSSVTPACVPWPSPTPAGSPRPICARASTRPR